MDNTLYYCFAHSLTLTLENVIINATYRNFHGPVNKKEAHFLHGINGTQMWDNGFKNIFSSSNVFIFHSSSCSGQFLYSSPLNSPGLQINVH